MTEPGPPIRSIEDRRRLCLWMLDQVRQNLAAVDREIVPDVYAIEAKLNDLRPRDPFPGEELLRLRLLGPSGEWLYESRLSIPLFGGSPSFDGQYMVGVPSYSNSAVRLTFEVQGETPRLR